MSRRRRSKEDARFEAILKCIGGIVLLTLLGSSATGQSFGVMFAKTWGPLLLPLAFVVAVAVAVKLVLWRSAIRSSANSAAWAPPSVANAQPSQPAHWNSERIERALSELDWYQFEKFCAALLAAEGCLVERKGGAKPDGGVDLVASKNGQSTLVQCKHWRSWKIQERVIRELLGSMTHYQAQRGALYSLLGATQPASLFAASHGIELVESRDLARRASATLGSPDLNRLLDACDRRCPKCDAPMVCRTGKFKPFWGCSTFPRCRGTIRLHDS